MLNLVLKFDLPDISLWTQTWNNLIRLFECYVFLKPTVNYTDVTLSICKTSRFVTSCFFPKKSISNNIPNCTGHEFPAFFKSIVNYSAQLSFRLRFKIYR